jgi:hypothetical protein
VAPQTLTRLAHISSPSQQTAGETLVDEADGAWQQDDCEDCSVRHLEAEQQPPENGQPPLYNAMPPKLRAATAIRLTNTFVSIVGLQEKYG